MKVSEHTISSLGSIITGNGSMSPYRSGPQLVTFFNQFGSDEKYGSGFPSRWYYAEEKLRELNDTPNMELIVIASVDPRYFLGTEHKIEKAVDHINQFLEYDGYEIIPDGRRWKLSKIGGAQVALPHPYSDSTEITHIFIDEQIEKCDNNPPKYDGNLPKLYKRAQKLLKLSPGQDGLADCLRQILSGLTSGVSGLSSLRNTMSDSHVISYKPSEHHAHIAVNASKTLCSFLFDSKDYQMKSKTKNT
jgi:Abortive infection C-terminus